MPELSRSPLVSSKEEFERLFNLHQKQPWTVPRQDHLFDLLAECGDPAQQRLVVELLYHYENFDEARSDQALSLLRTTIMQDWGLLPSNTLIVAMHKDTSPGSAQAILQIFKNKFAGSQWTEANFVANLGPTFGLLPNVSNVVFVDDFVGTGGQFSKSLDWYVKEIGVRKLSKPNFYLASICIMEQALQKLEERGVTHQAALYMKKGLADRYEGADLALRYAALDGLEASLRWEDVSQYQRYKYGFRQSEALFRHMNMNAPNNNFPMFWWRRKKDGSPRKTMQDRL